MTDPFFETADQPMSSTDTTPAPKDSAASPEQVRQLLLNRHVCPYCGNQTTGGSEACPRCTMEDSPATRQATKARIGPWHVLQSRNPSAPGMKYVTIVSLLRKGYITPKSVLRGPTTHQLWRFAAHVRGISREFGLCYSCGASIIKTAAFCPSCQRSQEPPADPDALLDVRQNGQGKPPAPVVETVPVPVQAPVVEVVPTQAIEPVSNGSYARRLRELNHRKTEEEERARQSNLPARRSTQPVFSGDSQTVSAMGLAQALRSNPPRELLVPSRKRLKALAAAAALVTLGGAALFYFRPDYRNSSIHFARDTWATIRTKTASLDWPRVTTAPPPRGTPASVEPRRVPEPPRYSSIETPATEPAVAAVVPAAAGSVQPPTVAVAEAPSQRDPAPDPEEIVNQSRALWGQAMDAEARQDFATAVRLYEQILQLPKDAWQGGLQINLDLARKRLQSSSAQ